MLISNLRPLKLGGKGFFGYMENLDQNAGSESQGGWCKDRFGVSWQVVPKILSELMADPIKGKMVMEAFMKMNKFDIQTLIDAGNDNN